MAKWKSRNFNCKHPGCKFKSKSPSGIGAHYKANPTHASLASAANPKNERYGRPPKKQSQSVRAIRARERRSVERGDVPTTATSKTKNYSMTASAVRDRKYRAEIKAGKRVVKKQNRTHRQPVTVVQHHSTSAACNYCPSCGFHLQPVNVSMQIVASMKDAEHG